MVGSEGRGRKGSFGFRRIALVNGHGGNSPAASLAAEWMADHPDVKVVMHNWWHAPRTWQAVQVVDAVASHGSWMENFPSATQG